jgi:hypothetical protein
MLRKLSVAFAATLAIVAASGLTSAAGYSGIGHVAGHHGTATHIGARSERLSPLPGVGYAGAGHRYGAGSVSGSGWNSGGFGGTRNPGYGYSFGPQLGGIGH